MKQIKPYSLSLSLLGFTGMFIILFGCQLENRPPSCVINIPSGGMEMPHGSQVPIAVDAVDTDGVVYGVIFYINNSYIGIDNRPPFHCVWNSIEYETGSHTIRATSNDDSGNSTSDEITVTLTEGVPQADFSVFRTSICPDSSARFYNMSLNNPTDWAWDFGDGGTADVQDPVHVYKTPGTYTVSLSVFNGYGSDTEIKTGFITVPDPLTDYDGNVYQTVLIGDQIWMRDNLKTTHYADGSPLIDGAKMEFISEDYTTKYYFAYRNDESYVNTYGRLYTWAAVMNGEESSETNPSGVQGVCPTGWHLPSDDEWQELEMFMGMDKHEVYQTEWRGSNEGTMLREPGDSHWRLYYPTDIPGTNESGFTALAGGSRSNIGSFENLKGRANFWSATESISKFAWCRRLYVNMGGVYRYDDYKSRAYSVRCVKD